MKADYARTVSTKKTKSARNVINKALTGAFTLASIMWEKRLAQKNADLSIAFLTYPI